MAQNQLCNKQLYKMEYMRKLIFIVTLIVIVVSIINSFKVFQLKGDGCRSKYST